MKINLAFSSCPNDTFIFDALVNNKIDTEGIEFNPIIADIDKLNNWSSSHRYDITKLSYYAFTKCYGTCLFLKGLWMDLTGSEAEIHMRTDANNLVTTASTTHLPEQKETSRPESG